MPRRQPPPDCITATEAIQRIGKSLYKYVEKGHLHPQGPATLKHKFYLESEVASIEAQEKRAFETKLHKMPAHFSQARASDMQSLYDLATRIFGSSTISPEKRVAWIEAEARGNYVVKLSTNEVVSYFYVQALTHDRIMKYMKECRGSTIRPDELLHIRPGAPLEMIIAGIGRDPRADKQYVAAALHGFAQDLAKWASEGIEISKFYAYSETLDGIYLSFSMGMQIWKRPRYIEGEGPFFTFVLDVQSSDIPLLRPYKQALAEYKRAHASQPLYRYIVDREKAEQKQGMPAPLEEPDTPTA